MLQSLRNAYLMEQWIAAYGYKVEQWFQILTFFDAYCSLGNFAFNHPSYTYPSLKPLPGIMAKAAGHPLMDLSNVSATIITLPRANSSLLPGPIWLGKAPF